jgi:glycosyltransferase involved in cell wall biosynthesis
LRIGIDAYPLSVRGGGIRRYTENLLRGLSRVDGENEYVLCRARPGTKRLDFGSSFAWDEHTLPMKRWVEQLWLVGDARDVDFFHGTNYFAPHFDRHPTVLTVHDLTVHLFPENHPLKRRLRHRLLPSLCRRSTRIIADSMSTKDDIVRHYNIAPDKIDVVYLAAGDNFHLIRDETELDLVRKRYALPKSFVLFVGTLEPRKNLAALLNAMGRLARSGFKRPLVIAGSGDPRYVASLKQLAHSQGLVLDEDVVFTGYVDDLDLPALYTLSDLFVYPSLYEGFGLPPLEAMACGAPVLLSHNSSLCELYEDCSALVNLADPDALPESIQRVLEDSHLRSRLLDLGLERAQARTWDAVASETLDIYSRVTQNTR